MARSQRAGSDYRPGGRKRAKQSATATPGSSMRITRGMTNSVARGAVLNTTELLESILITLPFKDIFVIQGVCQRWRNVIADSTMLQQKMFLRSCVEQETWILRSVKPLIDYYAVPGSPTKVVLVPASNAVTNILQSDIVPATLCPIVTRVDFVDEEDADGTDGVAFQGSLQVENLMKRPGTWQNMLLTDPPCKYAGLSFEVITGPRPSDQREFATSRFGVQVCCDGHVTLGAVADAILEPAADLKSKHGLTLLEGRGERTRSVIASLRGWREELEMVSFKVTVTMGEMVFPSNEQWANIRRKASE